MKPRESVRELNQLRVLDALRRAGTASRAQLMAGTGLSRTTVAGVIADLQARGLIVQRPMDDHRRGPVRGRPPVGFGLNASAGAAVGIDFGHRHVRVAVADLSSTVLAERHAEMDVDAGAPAALDAATELVGEVLAMASVDRDRVVAAGIGLPGPIDRRTGIVGSSSILPSWTGLNAASELERRLGLRIEVENDANLGALAEVSFGAASHLEDVVYVKMSSGIGAGLVLGGRLYLGANGVAGELGHVQVRPDGMVCRCGSRGCLETVASAGALIDLLGGVHGRDLTVAQICELVAAGDAGTRRVVNDAGRAVGRVLGDLCNSLNPAAIVIGGELSSAGDPLFDGIRDGVHRYAQPGTARNLEVLRAALGERAEVLGALALVIGGADRLRSAGLALLRQATAV